MSRRRRVALLIESSNAYARGLLEGIILYVRRHDAWSIYLPEQERGAKPPAWIAYWDGDGIIARIETDEIATAVRRTGLPAVDVSAARHLADIPWVETDDRRIAAMAVEHLVERGFRRLGFCGAPEFNWSRWRENHFRQCAREAGCELHVFPPSNRGRRGAPRGDQRDALTRWVRELPTPIGIMACYDIRAQQLLDVCRDLDIAVPEQVAVIGVDNDALLCELANPPLTSVAPNAHRSGYEAARLLDQMMRGDSVPPTAHLIEPLRIHTRQSTNVLAIDDPDVARALRYIREHAYEGINVADVIRQVRVSRRVLEHRFRQTLGRTPHQEILSLRINRVKELLREPDLSLAAIAARTGFEHVEYLSTAFKREIGLSPSQYRKNL